jgi:hypothetical protein
MDIIEIVGRFFLNRLVLPSYLFIVLSISWMIGMALVAPMMDHQEKYSTIDNISAISLLVVIAMVVPYYVRKHYSKIYKKEEYYGIPSRDWAIYGSCAWLGGFALTGIIMLIESS